MATDAGTSHVLVDVDANGVPTLFLRGSWSPAMAAALARDDWQALAIFGVDWPDYTPLLPYADRIGWLRVPFGPDSSAGLDELLSLHTLQCTDVLDPPLDYRRLPRLRELEAIWHARDVAHLAHPGLRALLLHKAGGRDLRWIPDGSALESLELRGGAVASLQGIDKARHLQALRAVDLRLCADIGEVPALAALEELELDCGRVALDDVDWLAALPRLRRVLVGCPVARIDWRMLGAHPSLASIGITATAGYAESDAQILDGLRAGGRETRSLQRFEAQAPGFAVEFARAH